MSILIKGMKMPKGCITCMFKSESLFNRTMWCEWLDDPLGDYTKCDEEWRHPDCPLVEVSTPHGRLIDGDKLLEKTECLFKDLNSTEDYMGIGYNHGVEDSIAIVKNAPTIEAEPVKHGHWVDDFCSFVCSVCGERISDSTLDDYSEPRYCPNCGARMDLNLENEDHHE